MSILKNVLAATGGIAILGYLGKKAADKIVSNLVITTGQPQLDKTTFSQGFFRLDLPVIITNNNPFPLGVDYFTGVIKYGQLTLTNVSLPQGVQVGAGQTVTVVLDIDIPIQTVFSDLSNLINSGNVFNAILNKITLDGSLVVLSSVATVTIPLNNITIPIV